MALCPWGLLEQVPWASLVSSPCHAELLCGVATRPLDGVLLLGLATRTISVTFGTSSATGGEEFTFIP